MRIKNLTFSYGKNNIFENIDFFANDGQITVIKGESGTGKSTLLDIIGIRHGVLADYQYKDELIDESFINNIFYIQQNSILPDDLKVIDQWHLLIDLYDHNFKLDQYIERLQLNNICNLYPHQLSGGEKQRVLLINAFIINKPILLLDEPTASINEELKIEFVKILEENKRNHIIIVSTHDNCFDNADVIYRIEEKHLILNYSLEENVSYSYDSYYDKKIKWFCYFVKIKKHQWFKNIIQLLLVSIIICSFIYILFMNKNFINSFSNHLSRKVSNSFIIYKALDLNYPNLEYDTVSNFPITMSELNEIKKVNHINNMIPKYIIPAYNYNSETGEYLPKDLLFKLNNKEILFDNSDSLYFETYDFSKEYNNITYLSNKKEGVYIHSKLLESLELTKDDIKSSVLSVTISIPISIQFGGFNYIQYNGNLNIPCCNLITKPIKIEVPVIGIINKNLNNTITPNTQQILITYDIIDKLINENKTTESKTIYYSNKINDYVSTKEEATETLIYNPYLPSAYTITVDSVDHVTEVASKLKDMGFTVQSDYFEYESLGNSIIQTKESLQLWSSIAAIVILVLLCIKQLFRNESEKTLNQWLEIIGINDRKELLILKLKKYILDLCISFVLCLFMLGIMIYFTLPLTGNTYDFDIMMIFVLFIINLLINIGIPMIWEVTYDRN